MGNLDLQSTIFPSNRTYGN